MIARKSIFRNINLLNILLIVFILIMVNHAVLPLLNIDLGNILPPQKKTVEEKEVRPITGTPPSLSDYVIIADENLYHPDRKIPPEKKPEGKPLPKPEIVVYGTVISDEARLAYVEDLKAPVNTTGRGKRQISLRQGEVISGFTLKSVEADKIVMVRGDEKMVIPVQNSQRSKAKAAGQAAPQTQAQAPGQAAPQTQTKGLRPEDLVEKQAPTRIRAPMKPADERARDFFNRQR